MAGVRVVYLILAAVFLVMLLGFAISAFYESPGYPIYGSWDSWYQAQEDHGRNVFFIGYAYGVVLLALGTALRPKLDIIKPALLLGGVGAIIYAISQPELAGEFRFAGSAVGFLVLLLVGYRTLPRVKPSKEEET